MEFINLGFLHHSAAVHIPLALAVLFPPFYLIICQMIKRGTWPKQNWYLVLGLVLIQIATTAVSYWTGLRDRTLSEASVELLDQHQQMALIFQGLWLGVAVLTPLAFVSPKRVALISHILLLILLATQLVYAIQLGQLGGRLLSGI